MIHAKRVLHASKPDIPNRHSPQKQHDLQPLEILHFDPIQIRFVQGHLTQPFENGNGDIRLLHATIFIFRRLAVGRIRDHGRLAKQQAHQVLGQLAIPAPPEA